VQDNRGASVYDELPSKEILKSQRPSTFISAGSLKIGLFRIFAWRAKVSMVKRSSMDIATPLKKIKKKGEEGQEEQHGHRDSA
jgi:hypothetical protein